VNRQPSSIGDPAMRHGRKTKTRPFTGVKRPVIKLVGADLIVDAVSARPTSRSMPRWPRSLRRSRRGARSRSSSSTEAIWAVRPLRRCTTQAPRFAPTRGPAPIGTLPQAGLHPRSRRCPGDLSGGPAGRDRGWCDRCPLPGQCLRAVRA
jgi:hypothetical protein